MHCKDIWDLSQEYFRSDNKDWGFQSHLPQEQVTYFPWDHSENVKSS